MYWKWALQSLSCWSLTAVFEGTLADVQFYKKLLQKTKNFHPVILIVLVADQVFAATEQWKIIRLHLASIMTSCIWNRVHLFYRSFYLFSCMLFVFVSKNGRSEFKLTTMQKTWFESSSVIIPSRILEFCFALCARFGNWKGLKVTSMVF